MIFNGQGDDLQRIGGKPSVTWTLKLETRVTEGLLGTPPALARLCATVRAGGWVSVPGVAPLRDLSLRHALPGPAPGPRRPPPPPPRSRQAPAPQTRSPPPKGKGTQGNHRHPGPYLHPHLWIALSPPSSRTLPSTWELREGTRLGTPILSGLEPCLWLGGLFCGGERVSALPLLGERRG